jgi:hypothetical protein
VGTADRFWRLRRGSLGVALVGTTDGVFVDLFLGPVNQTYWEDVTVKVWAGANQDVSSETVHGSLSGLAADDHLQYLLLAGRAGGQVGYGDTAASGSLSLSGTAHATPGPILLNTAGGNVGLGVAVPLTQFHMHESTSAGAWTYFTNSTTGSGATSGLLFGMDLNENAVLYHYPATDIILATNNTEMVRILSTGKIGFGTATPQELGHFQKDQSATTLVEIENATDDTESRAGLKVTGGGAGGSGFLMATAATYNDIATWGDALILSADSALSGGIIVYNPTSINLRTTAVNSDDFILNSTGQLGIGVTPAAGSKVHIHENSVGPSWIQYTNNTTGSAATDGSRWGIDGSGNLEIRNRENAGINWYTNDSIVMGLSSAGFLGVGPITPATRLDVDGVLTLRPTANISTIQTNDANSRIDFIADRGSTTSLAFKFRDAADNASMGILDNGKVAIGDFTPSANLDVGAAAVATLTGATVNAVGIGGNTTGRLLIAGSGQGDIILYDEGGTATYEAMQLVTTGDITKFRVLNDSGWGITTDDIIAMDHATGYSGFGTASPADRLHAHVATSGAIYLRFTNTTTGITDDDGFKFGINAAEGGEIWQEENNYIRWGTNDVERMRLLAGGDLGIGLVAPVDNLHIHKSSSGAARVRFTNTTTGVTTGDGFYVGINSTEGADLWQKEANYIRFGTNNIQRLMLTSGGNLGVEGQNTPVFPLSFATGTGDKIALYDDGASNQFGFGIQSSLLQIYTNASTDRVGIGYGTSAAFTEILTVKTDSVGVNKTAPTGTLHVDQSSASGAKPVLTLDQADSSEEFIRFVSAVGAGAPIAETALGTYYGRVRVHVEGVGDKYIGIYNA